MRRLVIGLLALGSISAFSSETCVYVFQESDGKPLQAFASCSGDKEGSRMKIINNDGPLSKAQHLAELQEKRGMKLVNCTLAVREKIAVNECILTKM